MADLSIHHDWQTARAFPNLIRLRRRWRALGRLQRRHRQSAVTLMGYDERLLADIGLARSGRYDWIGQLVRAMAAR